MTEVLEKSQLGQEWAYQTDRTLIVPYVGGGEAFPEDFLVRLYFQMKQDQLFNRTFPYNNSDFSLSWFINFFYKRTLLLGVVKPSEVAGISWLYDIDGNANFKKATVGVSFFRKYWGSTALHDLCRCGLRWYFEKAGMSIIFGTIAVHNRLSVRYSRMMGFKPVGVAPMFMLKDGSPIDMYLTYLKREDFFARLSEG